MERETGEGDRWTAGARDHQAIHKPMDIPTVCVPKKDGRFTPALRGLQETECGHLGRRLPAPTG